MIHLCKEKYRLELHWDSVQYNTDGVAVLKGAYFSGPALKLAQKIEFPDSLRLDLTPQHITVLKSYYIVKLAWQKVEYLPDSCVSLCDPVITNDYLKTIHKLEDKDFIVIDTEDHEEATHPYHLVYESQVVRYDKEPYKYSENK